MDSQLENEAIAQAWIEFAARQNPDTGDLAVPATLAEAHAADADWAWLELAEIEDAAPERALDICILIARLTDDAWVLSNLGAGPLESLLFHDWATVLDRLEAEAPRSPGLAEAISSIWPSRMPAAALARLTSLGRRPRPTAH